MECFEAGLKTYNVDYNGSNIVSMENTSDPNNKVRLEYQYSNGELLAIKVKDKNGFTLRHCIFSFSPSHQLLQMDWDTADGNVGFYLQQTLTFTYYPDWNLLQMVVHTGDIVNFDIEYTYTYDDKRRPVMKKGNGTYTVGTNAAQPFETQSTF